nr:hypothetical protein [uncultured Psychrobacter sp.]
MTTRDDGQLNNDYIKSKIKDLSPRLLYVLMTEVSLNKSQSISVIDVDYLSRKIAKLNIISEDLDSYIDIAHNHVLDDKTVDWIFKSLRVVLWFDNYLKRSKPHYLSPYILEFQPIVRTTYIDDCLKEFDTCYILIREEANDIDDDRSMSDGRYVRVMKPRDVGRQVYDRSTNLSARPVREPYNTNSTSNRHNPTLHVNKHTQQFERKSEFITYAKTDYTNCRTPNKHLEWLDKKNEEQLMWAQEYLLSQGLLLQPNSLLIDSLDDLYDQICASLDIIDTGLGYNSTTYEISGMSLEKKEIIRKMRGAWSQKKFRDKKDAESALEYVLNRRHINKLKKLASEYGVSSAEYLQQLIDEAYNSTE